MRAWRRTAVACFGCAMVFGLAASGMALSAEPSQSNAMEWDRADRTPGDVRDDNVLKMKFAWVPPGEFLMDTDPWGAWENPEPVQISGDTITIPFIPEGRPKPGIQPTSIAGCWVAQFEVTQSQWRQLMKTTPWVGKRHVGTNENCPVTYVNWHDARTFCRTLTAIERQTGRLPDDWRYTLPTEAQWEYACRAGTTADSPFDSDPAQLDEYAWCKHNTIEVGESYAHPVGKKQPNAWALYDMHGNVWEWMADRCRYGLEDDSRAYRGGSWSNSPEGLRATSMNGADPRAKTACFGFRVIAARIVESEKE